MLGRSPTQGVSNLGKRGRSKFWPIFAYRSGAVEFHQILSLFNPQPNRPRASPAIFKHVGQVPYSRGFKFGEKGADQNFGLFLLTRPALLNFIKILSLFNTQPNKPRASTPQFLSMYGRSPTQGPSNLGKRGRSKFWPIFGYRSRAVEFHQNFKSFQHTT